MIPNTIPLPREKDNDKFCYINLEYQPNFTLYKPSLILTLTSTYKLVRHLARFGILSIGRVRVAQTPMGNSNSCCSSHTDDDDDISHHQKYHGMRTKSKPESQMTSPTVVVIRPDQHQGDKEGKKSGLEKNNAFSDYINRAKIIIRTTTNMAGGKNASQEDKVGDAKKEENVKLKDMFSDYIHSAKMKIRKTSSSVGKSKNVSHRID